MASNEMNHSATAVRSAISAVSRNRESSASKNNVQSLGDEDEEERYAHQPKQVQSTS